MSNLKPVLKMIPPGVSCQKEEERLRASIRRESQQRRMREKQHARGLSSSYLEPDRYDDDEEGDETISLAAIKSKFKGGGGLRGEGGYFIISHKIFMKAYWTSSMVSPNSEERARIYSSDSDEGSDDDKAQRLMKAKKLDSDEVGVVSCCTDRGQCNAVYFRA